MTKIIKIIIILLSSFLLITMTTCSKKKLFKKMSYNGTLLDTIGGKTVSGIRIQLYACYPQSWENCDYYKVGESYTDDAGNFSIREKAARSDRYEIIIDGGIYSGTPINGHSGISESTLNEKYSVIYLNSR